MGSAHRPYRCCVGDDIPKEDQGSCDLNGDRHVDTNAPNAVWGPFISRPPALGNLHVDFRGSARLTADWDWDNYQ